MSRCSAPRSRTSIQCGSRSCQLSQSTRYKTRPSPVQAAARRRPPPAADGPDAARASSRYPAPGKMTRPCTTCDRPRARAPRPQGGTGTERLPATGQSARENERDSRVAPSERAPPESELRRRQHRTRRRARWSVLGALHQRVRHRDGMYPNELTPATPSVEERPQTRWARRSSTQKHRAAWPTRGFEDAHMSVAHRRTPPERAAAP
jgi:hypothetical protein